MFQADATIAWVDGSGMAQAQDYYLSNYVQVWENNYSIFIPGVHVLFSLCVSHSVVVDQGRVQTPWIRLPEVPAPTMSLMCLVLYKKVNSVSHLQDRLIQVNLQ